MYPALPGKVQSSLVMGWISYIRNERKILTTMTKEIHNFSFLSVRNYGTRYTLPYALNVIP